MGLLDYRRTAWKGEKAGNWKKMYRLTFTAEWNIARFPSLVGISCIAPRSYWRWIRIAAVVPSCRATPFRIVSIILRSWVRCMRCIRCPRLTRPSIYSRAQSSRVLTSFLSYFTICTKPTFTRSTYKLNKKLRYREDHSASVVLCWCTLWPFSGENVLTANQLLFCNRYRKRKLPNLAKYRKIRAITPFKVI